MAIATIPNGDTACNLKSAGYVNLSESNLRFIFSQRLRGAARELLEALVLRCGQRSFCWPSVRHLAELIGRTRRTVQLAMRALEERGLVERGESRGGRGRRTTYRLPWLEPTRATPDRAPDEKNERRTTDSRPPKKGATASGPPSRTPLEKGASSLRPEKIINENERTLREDDRRPLSKANPQRGNLARRRKPGKLPRNIQRHDLENPARLRALYRQSQTRLTEVAFAALAQLALRGKRPAALFVYLCKREAVDQITPSLDAKARRLLNPKREAVPTVRLDRPERQTEREFLERRERLVAELRALN